MTKQLKDTLTVLGLIAFGAILFYAFNLISFIKIILA